MTGSDAKSLGFGSMMVALLLLPLVGCTFDPRTCTSDAECPSKSYCARPDGEASAVCLPIRGDQPDAGPTDDSDGAAPPRKDTAVPDGDFGEPGTCRVARDCQVIGDDVPLNEEPFGCPRSEFVPFQTTVEGAVCADAWIWHDLEFVRCRDSAIEVEVVFYAGTDCARDLALRVSDESYICGRNGMECEQRGDGRFIMRLPIEPSDFPTPVETLTFTVESSVAQDYEYTLEVTVRR